MDTAFALFYREGYHAVGIDKILRTAGLAKMTLYHHFKSKEDLIVAVLERRGREISSRREQALKEAGTSPRKRLEALFIAYEAWFKSSGFSGCAFIRAIGEYPDAASPVHQAATAVKRELIATLTEILGDLKVQDPTRLAHQIYLLVEGAIVSAHTFSDPGAAAQARDAALTLVAASR
ncbi:TetR/AcrR family transcriptional regulator [Synoicihabitans lomoniglobus]|uniref:TetR/AcrR family transcriptional regulator n=1 Tax=Synoicihabitans lomoniglobus TaxID=2909285 RepID=A0AAE9ZXW2_9BACT|nr:TetR/AcrR family transcriptional regulator [Opitutaceae bacterium LMO-M01]WED64975.1 TetR/AcrR family transcriptional regulator [Opitutaceae bacterium LMO-M01]